MNCRNYLYIALLFLAVQTSAQNARKVYPVAFYNLENLFDTYRDTTINDEEFTPGGANNWTMGKYTQKLNNMARAIRAIGAPYSVNGPAVLGVCELENRKVLEDLVATGLLSDGNWGIIHYDSPDRRGVDVALLYKKDIFHPFSHRVYPYNLPGDTAFRTRDQLLVSGTLGNDTLHIIVNHWPSRYGAKSSRLREFAASIVKGICDSLYQRQANAKIVIMGDLNDNPDDKSVREVLQAKRNIKDVKDKGLFNTMWKFFDQGIGSLSYQGQWNLFDQIIISRPLLNAGKGLKYVRSEVFNHDFLIQQEGRYKGYPHRTFSANVFVNGYSDHLPTLIYLAE